MSELRLARVRNGEYREAQVFAIDGDWIAFRYDNGHYGWAERRYFVTLEEGQRIQQEREERQAVMQRDNNARMYDYYLKQAAASERMMNHMLEAAKAYAPKEDEWHH